MFSRHLNVYLFAQLLIAACYMYIYIPWNNWYRDEKKGFQKPMPCPGTLLFLFSFFSNSPYFLGKKREKNFFHLFSSWIRYIDNQINPFFFLCRNYRRSFCHLFRVVSLPVWYGGQRECLHSLLCLHINFFSFFSRFPLLLSPPSSPHRVCMCVW